MSRTCITHGEMKYSCKILVGRPQEKRPLGRNMRRAICKGKICLEETGCENVYRNKLAQNGVQWRAFVNSVTNLRIL